MRITYVKDEPNSRPGASRYKAILGFRDGGVDRLAHIATVRRGAVHGSMRWICSWNPRFLAADGSDNFDRATYREARAELEATLFIELVGYRIGGDILAVDVDGR